MKKLLLLLIPLIHFSCDIYENETNESFLFIEIVTHNSSVIVSGDSCLNMQIDFPMYYYDSLEKKLDIYHQFRIDHSTKYLLGSGQFLSGAIGGGGGSHVEALSSGEYHQTKTWTLSDNNDDLWIFFIDNEAVVFNLNDSLSFTLLPGESKTIENKYFGRYSNDTCLHDITRSVIYINHGIIPKSNISSGKF